MPNLFILEINVKNKIKQVTTNTIQESYKEYNNPTKKLEGNS